MNHRLYIKEEKLLQHKCYLYDAWIKFEWSQVNFVKKLDKQQKIQSVLQYVFYKFGDSLRNICLLISKKWNSQVYLQCDPLTSKHLLERSNLFVKADYMLSKGTSSS